MPDGAVPRWPVEIITRKDSLAFTQHLRSLFSET
jgi:hypothetical protein